MSKVKDYIQLHLNILLFSLTSVFSKFASIQYNRHGLSSPLLYLFLFLMVANCGIYAITWQQVIKKFSLSTAYANKSVYLLWSQIWAVVVFHENLSIQNIIGILVVLFGVWTVQRYEQNIYFNYAGRNFFLRSLSDTSKTKRKYQIWKPNPGISQFPGNSLLCHIYADSSAEYLVLYKSRYALWSCYRYSGICVCSSSLSFHSEGKDYKRKDHRKSDHHCRNSNLYALNCL